jgi:hypothetical protein
LVKIENLRIKQPSFGDLIGRAESSSKVDEEAERTSWLAAIESPERSETEPEGTIDGGFD